MFPPATVEPAFFFFFFNARLSRRSTVDRLRVAQENIELVPDPDLIPETLFFMAGKFFKRFDRANCKFVSNIREFYPDD